MTGATFRSEEIGAQAATVDGMRVRIEPAGVDSLWLPEHVYGAAVEPFTGIAFALARTRRASPPS